MGRGDQDDHLWPPSRTFLTHVASLCSRRPSSLFDNAHCHCIMASVHPAFLGSDHHLRSFDLTGRPGGCVSSAIWGVLSERRYTVPPRPEPLVRLVLSQSATIMPTSNLNGAQGASSQASGSTSTSKNALTDKKFIGAVEDEWILYRCATREAPPSFKLTVPQ